MALTILPTGSQCLSLQIINSTLINNWNVIVLDKFLELILTPSIIAPSELVYWYFYVNKDLLSFKDVRAKIISDKEPVLAVNHRIARGTDLILHSDMSKYFCPAMRIP